MCDLSTAQFCTKLQNANAKSREFGQEENLFWREEEGGADGTRPSASGGIIRILVLLRTLKKKKLQGLLKSSINPEKEVGRESKD